MTPALECRDLVLDYGNGTVVGPISLEVAPGTCVAVVGPNGAGKSSLLHMILGLRRPTSGRAFIHGEPADLPLARRGVGYLQEAVSFSDRARADDLLRVHCRLTGAFQGGNRKALEAYLESFGLEWSRNPLRIYSKGMKQRLALALAMLDCGRLLILDEPNSGLDPVGIATLRSKLEETKRAGSSLLLSTHRLAEVMQMADRLIVIHRGRVVGDKPMAEFADFDALERFFLVCVR